MSRNKNKKKKNGDKDEILKSKIALAAAILTLIGNAFTVITAIIAFFHMLME